jgi:hypothetical protein
MTSCPEDGLRSGGGAPPRQQVKTNGQLHAPAVLIPGKETDVYSVSRRLDGPQNRRVLTLWRREKRFAGNRTTILRSSKSWPLTIRTD